MPVLAYQFLYFGAGYEGAELFILAGLVEKPIVANISDDGGPPQHALMEWG